MRLQTRLAWAFALVALAALVVVLLSVNMGMYYTMGHMRGAGMMGPGHMGGMMGALFSWSLGAGLAAVALAGLVGWWLAGQTARPLGQLLRATRQLGMQDLAQRVSEPGTGDEVAELARSFNRMAERLQREDAARRQMLADVAHELRHPVAVVQSQLELLQDGVRPLTPENLAGLQDEVLRLGRLIGDLQDLSLAEAGALTLQRQAVAPAELLEPLVGHLGPLAEEKSITLELQVDPAAPVVCADPQRLRQVVVNLLSNALRHTPPGGRISVAATRAEDGGLRISVADTGSGIDPQDLPHIFDRFYRADRSRSRQGGGAGLGLAIARSLVGLHGGTIGVESSPRPPLTGRAPEGSRFTVTLPPHGGAARTS